MRALDRLEIALGDLYSADACCVTLITGSNAEIVYSAYGADLVEPPIPREEAAERGLAWVALLPQVNGLMAVEPNGVQGVRAAVLKGTSSGGRAASVLWTADGESTLCLAQAGHVLTVVDPQEPIPVDDPDVAMHFHDLDFDQDWLDSALVVLERFTGMRIGAVEPSSITSRCIVPQLDDPSAPGRGVTPASRPVRTNEDIAQYSTEWSSAVAAIGLDGVSRLTEAAIAAEDRGLRRATVFAVRRALQLSQLDRDPDLAPILEALEAGGAPPTLSTNTKKTIRLGLHEPDDIEPPASWIALTALTRALDGKYPLCNSLDAIWRSAQAVHVVDPDVVGDFLTGTLDALER